MAETSGVQPSSPSMPPPKSSPPSPSPPSTQSPSPSPSLPPQPPTSFDPPPSTDPDTTDPPLLSEHSTFRLYATARFVYPSVRVFHRPHPRAAELPPLPLLVFVHGLGGSVAQFHPLLSSLAHVAPCLAVDLPGCGRSAFVEASWAAYTPRALADLLAVVVARHRVEGQQVVLVGHSMGTSLCALLAESLRDCLVGVVAICPIAAGPGRMAMLKLLLLRALFWVPGWMFDLWRWRDRRGGLESASVARFVGRGASRELKVLQAQFNDQSRIPVWRRMARGCLPAYGWDGTQVTGLAGKKEWGAITVPVFLVGGEDDNITSPREIDKITRFLRVGKETRRDTGKESPLKNVPDSQAIPDSAAPVDVTLACVAAVNPAQGTPPGRSQSQIQEQTETETETQPHASPAIPSPLVPPTQGPDSSSNSTPPSEPPASSPPTHPPHHHTVETFLLPSPANHTLLYHPSISRTLAGLVSDFLAAHVSPQLSLGWQLQHLSREGKWDVKNLAKWRSVAPVSAPIGPPGHPPVFRAMKTLREADEDHCPAEFVSRWAASISDVVDISSDRPVYDPWGLERAGVLYYKFPTVSKVPPASDEVERFIALIDRLRAERVRRNAPPGDGNDDTASTPDDQPTKHRNARAGGSDAGADDRVIGVHCHYGFNRTGYFLVCYLVERCGMPVHEAIAAFAAARPNGIRHPHFLDKLYMRYQLGAGKATP